MVFEVSRVRVGPAASPKIRRRLAHVARCAVAASVLSTVGYVRSPELAALCRLFTSSSAWLAYSLAAALTLATSAAVARRPLAATVVACLAIVALCDGPVLYSAGASSAFVLPSSSSSHYLARSVAGEAYVVTGANSGLGLAAARFLTRRGATVVLACRSTSRCEAAAQGLGERAVVFWDVALDLADLRSVDAYAGAVRRRFRGGLDGLVLNAGFAGMPGDGLADVTRQGLELSFGTMVVAHARLEDRLEPLLRKGRGRVVWVASEAHHVAAPLDASVLVKGNKGGGGGGDLHGERCSKATPLDARFIGAPLAVLLDWWSRLVMDQGFGCAYTRAKMSNVLVAMARGDSVAAPGFVQTDIFGKTTNPALALLTVVPLRLVMLAMRRVDVGVVPVLRALLDDEAAGKVVDSMARPYAYQGMCWATGGCDAATARRLDTVVRDLGTRKEVEPPLSVPRRRQKGGSPGVDDDLSAPVAQFGRFRKVAAAGAVAAVGAAVGAAAVLTPTGAPPGRFLNVLNAVLEEPFVAALLDATVWLVLALVYVALAPWALVVGVSRSARRLVAQRPTTPSRDRAVVITGCDSGFGRALALKLAGEGYTVFAGCLTDDAREDLGRVPGIRSLAMDVTSDDDVAASAGAVERWARGGGPSMNGAGEEEQEEQEEKVVGGAWATATCKRVVVAVVCNAGVGTPGYTDWVSMAGFERDVAVNYLGVVRVAKAFSPMLRREAAPAAQAPGAVRLVPRLLVVGSMSSKLPVPYLASYAASKHAVAGFASCLRVELAAWGVAVCTVLPSFHKTPLLNGGVAEMERVWASADPRERALYGTECFAATAVAGKRLMTDFAWDPTRVVDALARAATSTEPPLRELVIGSDARVALTLLYRLPPAIYERCIALITTELATPPAGASY